jgi:hypothetical protein
VVNIRGSASAFTSQSVTVFDFFYKPKDAETNLKLACFPLARRFPWRLYLLCR